MTYYNLTNITGSNNFLSLTTNVSDMSGGWLGIGIMLTFTIIIFISLKDYPMKESFAATFFVSTIIALLFKIIGLLSDFVLFIYIIAAAISIIALIFDKG